MDRNFLKDKKRVVIKIGKGFLHLFRRCLAAVSRLRKKIFRTGKPIPIPGNQKFFGIHGKKP